MLAGGERRKENDRVSKIEKHCICVGRKHNEMHRSYGIIGGRIGGIGNEE
jgi:hypothetical protein